MSLEQVHTLMDEYAKWRETEAVARQEVDDAEARAIAAELRLREVREAHKLVMQATNAAHRAMADAIERCTTPPLMLFLTDDVR